MVNYSYLKNFSTPIMYFLGTIFILSFIQWISIQFLATYCSEWSIFGPIKNIMNLGSPFCNFINKLQISIVDHYIILWTTVTGIVVGYFVSKLTAGLPVKN